MRVRTHSDAAVALLRGTDLLTDLVRVSFGPNGAPVIMNSPGPESMPELVTRGAVIARRILEVEDPFVNMGMLIARQMACRVDDAVRDGAATALLIYRRLLHGAFRLRAAGARPDELAEQIRDAADSADRSLVHSVLPMDAEAAARSLVATTGLTEDLADAIVRAVLGTGTDGAVELARAKGNAAELELLEGFHARASIVRSTTHQRLSAFADARVLVSEVPWSDVPALARVAATVKAGGWSTLLVVAPSIGEAVRNAITNVTDASLTVIAAEVGHEAESVLPDLAAYLGTTPVAPVLGDDLAALPLGRLGTVRRGWVSQGRFGIVTGEPHPDTAVRIAALRTASKSTDDPEIARGLRMRAGVLAGASAILRVPSATDAEAVDDHARAESVLYAGRLAMSGGVVAGGGAALARVDIAPPTLGAELLREALAEPARVLAARAGLEPTTHIASLRNSAEGDRFDFDSGEWLSAGALTVVDPVEVLRCALATAVSAAVSAIGTTSLISVPHPQMSVTP